MKGTALSVPTACSSATHDDDDATESAHAACDEHRQRRSSHAWPLPWISLNLFFSHTIRPTFSLFDSCEPAAIEAEQVAMPSAHAHALKKLGVWEAIEAYCVARPHVPHQMPW